MSRTKFKRTKPHTHVTRPGPAYMPRHSVLAIALSHAILQDQVDFRIAQEDAAAAEAVTATIDAGGP